MKDEKIFKDGDRVAYIRNWEVLEGTLQISKKGKYWVKSDKGGKHLVSVLKIYDSVEKAKKVLESKKISKKKKAHEFISASKYDKRIQVGDMDVDFNLSLQELWWRMKENNDEVITPIEIKVTTNYGEKVIAVYFRIFKGNLSMKHYNNFTNKFLEDKEYREQYLTAGTNF